MNEQAPKKITIDNLRMADINELSAFSQTLWLDTYPNPESGISESKIISMFEEGKKKLDERKQRYQERLSNHNIFMKVARSPKGEIIGTIRGEKFETNQELGAMYVHPNYQGKGVAQQLMLELENWFDSDKPTFLWVTDYNQRAIRYYQKNGFKIIEGTEKPFKQLPEMIIIKMERPAKEQIYEET